MLRSWNILRLSKRRHATKLTEHQKSLMARSLPKRISLPGVEHVVVVASGKGGVGKSTIAVNLSATLASLGKRVGLLDADIAGPCIPLMMNVHEQPLVNDAQQMIPPVNYGVKCLSMGQLGADGSAFIWRGPLVMSALQRLLKGAVWGPLDVLIIDTPPGTGDVHLSIQQNVTVSGVLLVSTPQTAALNVALRGAQMYQTLNVPVLGLVENMGYAICGKCQHHTEIFKNVTSEYVQKMKTSVVAQIPLDGNITESCDIGVPMVVKHPDSEYTKTFKNLASVVLEKLDKQSKEKQKSEKDTVGN